MAETNCKDPKCPIHGQLRTRGKSFTAVVKSAKMQKSVTIEFERPFLVKKYHRYEKRYTTIKAHNPDCINVKEGQEVEIMECRPLSKTITFVVTKIVEAKKQ